jgi:hypothetical protein
MRRCVTAGEERGTRNPVESLMVRVGHETMIA